MFFSCTRKIRSRQSEIYTDRKSSQNSGRANARMQAINRRQPVLVTGNPPAGEENWLTISITSRPKYDSGLRFAAPICSMPERQLMGNFGDDAIRRLWPIRARRCIECQVRNRGIADVVNAKPSGCKGPTVPLSDCLPPHRVG